MIILANFSALAGAIVNEQKMKANDRNIDFDENENDRRMYLD